MKPGERVQHRVTKQRGEVLVTYTRPEDGAPGADWRPDGQSTAAARQDQLRKEG